MTVPVTVVAIRSISFTGTTWLNCLLGCHDRAFALGAPDRVVNLYEQGWRGACRVHDEGCSFWPGFHKQYDPEGNFYLQLSRSAGRDYIVINNPVANGKAEKDLYHPDIVLKHVRVVRDGRAVCRSFLRNHAGKDFLYTVKEWFLPGARGFEFDPQDPEVFCLRYEDMTADQFGLMKKLGRFVGLEYPENFYKFWEFEHHLTAGNSSLYGMIRRFQQGRKFTGKRKDFYEREFQRLCREPEKPVFDDRWKEGLSRRELFVFDLHCGYINEQWGYARDTFTAAEFQQFGSEIAGEAVSVAPGAGPLVPARPDWLREIVGHLRRNPLVTRRKLLWVLLAVAASYFLTIVLTALVVWWLAR